MILYIVLCGYPPFGGSTENEILNKVKSGKFKFDGNIIFLVKRKEKLIILDDDWSGISQDAKALIKKMLTYNSKERISALDALNDKWIQANSTQNQLNVKFLTNLSGFHVSIPFYNHIIILSFHINKI